MGKQQSLPKRAKQDLQRLERTRTKSRSSAVTSCDVCPGRYTHANDLLRFGTLRDCNGKVWRVCGDCITALWNIRNEEKRNET